jgi:hypothetical protein
MKAEQAITMCAMKARDVPPGWWNEVCAVR